MNKREKAVEWMKRHADEIAATATFAAVVALTVAAIKVDYEVAKDEAQKEQDRQNMLLQAIAEGKTILPNTDGSYWIV